MNPVPQNECARCGKPAPGELGGRVAIMSPKQQFTYKFTFCEPCMDVLHAKLGELIGKFCNEVQLPKPAQLAPPTPLAAPGRPHG